VPTPRFDQANVLASSNELGSALGSIDRAIGNEPIEPRFYGLKGDIYLKKREYSKANGFYDKALNLDPEYYEYYLGRGLSLAKLGRSEAARQDLERSNELLPTAIAMNQLGQLSLSRGDHKSAKAYFQSAMTAGGDTGQEATAAFTQLDLPENPGRYLRAEVYGEEGRLIANIENLTGLLIREFEITFYATVNGDEVRRTVTSGRLNARQHGRVNSGLRFKSADVVESVYARVTAASL
jgi:beta-barrel assembly-enhancing protease